MIRDDDNGLELINASAGSGKTYTLAERVLMILGNGLTPDLLGATTFTNKAAAELRERIRLKLIENDLQSSADRISEGFIGTVNSICARLLREYAVDAGLSPAIDVLPEDDADRLFRVATSNSMQRHAETIEPIAFRLSRDDQGTKYERHDWQEDVRRIVALARVNMLDRTALLESAESSKRTIRAMLGNPMEESHFNSLDTEIESALARLVSIPNPTKMTLKAITDLRRYLRLCRRQGQIRWADWQAIAKLEVQANARDVVVEVTRIAGDLPSHPAFQKDMIGLIDAVFACAADAMDAYEQFKMEHGLMDFTDQETRVLQLARKNEMFRESMRLRLRRMMVDEFQDTNPTQLALFLEFHGFAEASVWVGDPKQAIYGFRDADPRLMAQASGLCTKQSTLPHSWRSKRELVTFTNTLFSRAFHDMPAEHVTLTIPTEREKEADGGWIESWLLVSTKKRDRDYALAHEVVHLIDRKQLPAGDVAILCRSHKDCRSVAAALESCGIRASASRGRLVDAPECRLAMAALRVMQDSSDSIALAAVMRHVTDSGSDEWLAALITSPPETKEAWRTHPIVERLRAEAANLFQRTPSEALESAIDAIDMQMVLTRWGNSEVRRGNLDLLRKLCDEYLDHCRSRRSAATVYGFVAFAEASDKGEVEGIGSDTVKVLTYHAAKGLEWPVVILHSLNPEWRADAFGVSIEESARFDPADPLAGRSIRYWPWPFAAKGGVTSFVTRANSRSESVQAVCMEWREELRKLYVGMTRARDGVILAVEKKTDKSGKTKLPTRWLDLIQNAQGEPLLALPHERGSHTLHIDSVRIAIESHECWPVSDADDGNPKLQPEFAAAISFPVTEYPLYRLTPSKPELDGKAQSEFQIAMHSTIGPAVVFHGHVDEQHVGNCIHAFLALDRSAMKTDRSVEAAESFLKRWSVEDALKPADLVSIADNLDAWITQTYPDSRLFRECPLTLTDAQHRHMAGRADMLIETTDGWVIVDHKSLRTLRDEHILHFGLQLQAYAHALTLATGKPVNTQLIHLPLAGVMHEISHT